MTIRSLQWTCLALSLAVHAAVLYGLGRSQWLAAPVPTPILSVNLVGPPVAAPKPTATPRAEPPRPTQPSAKPQVAPTTAPPRPSIARTQKNKPPGAGVPAVAPAQPQPVVAPERLTRAVAQTLSTPASMPPGSTPPAQAGTSQDAHAVTTDTAAADAPVGAAAQSGVPVALSTDLALACPNKSPAVYPTLSRRLNESGTVLLRVEVDERGTVAAAGIERSSGFARLDAAALAAVRTWHCRAPTHNGQPVRATALQPFHFKLQD